MTLTPYLFPLVREGTTNLTPVNCCIYCAVAKEDSDLTDEHILPDGLGGDLVLPKASCKDCASKTSRAELHFLREVLRYVRGVAGVRSRKRKSARPEVAVKMGDATAVEEQLAVDETAPFMLIFPITHALPTRLGGPAQPPDARLRLALFGDDNWIEKARKWIGGKGGFRFSNRLHAGIMGQALAKIAHAYACAVLGPEGFTPFLASYILAKEPSLDLENIGIFPSEGIQDAMHYLDLQIANVPVQTAIGVASQEFIVAYIRLFASRPSPSVLVVVGKPNAAIAPSLKKMNLVQPPI